MNKKLLFLALCGGLAWSQASPTPTVAPSVAPAPTEPPMPLTPAEKLQLENFQLKLQLLQRETQQQFSALQSDVQSYEKAVLSAHPGSGYKLNLGTLTWELQPHPQPVKEGGKK